MVVSLLPSPKCLVRTSKKKRRERVREGESGRTNPKACVANGRGESKGGCGQWLRLKKKVVPRLFFRLFFCHALHPMFFSTFPFSSPSHNKKLTLIKRKILLENYFQLAVTFLLMTVAQTKKSIEMFLLSKYLYFPCL